MYNELDFLQMQSQGEYTKAKEINSMKNQSNAPYGIEDPIKEDVDVKTEEVAGRIVSVETGEISRPHLVLPIAGQPENGTSFPKEEKLVWGEIKRVIDEMVQNMATKGNFRLLIPVWNKYDLEFLRSAERHNLPVTFVLPTKSWGESRLPKFQSDLVIRMKARKENKVIVHRGKSYAERVNQSIKVADLILGLDNGNGMQQFYSTINNSKGEIKPFPMNRMEFTTEEEGIGLKIEQSEVLVPSENMLPGL